MIDLSVCMSIFCIIVGHYLLVTIIKPEQHRKLEDSLQMTPIIVFENRNNAIYDKNFFRFGLTQKSIIKMKITKKEKGFDEKIKKVE